MDRRAAVRLAALTVVAGGVLAVAVHLDRQGPASDLASASGGSAVSRTAGPAGTPVGAPSGAPSGARSGARADLERGLARSATSARAVVGSGPVDESLPHRHVLDPETGGLVSLAGAGRTFPDAKHLGPLHEDPLPPDVSVDDPTDTASLLERAGDVEAARTGDQPFEAAATAPIGTPTIATLSEHVAPSCSGTGEDGNRVQPLYVHEASTPSRFTDVLPILRNAVANVDDVFAVSAQQTGGERRVRWVHDADCQPVIKSVTVPDGSIGDSFMETVNAVKALGPAYTLASRKYLMFTDADKLCGIASVYDDPSLTRNANNGRYASYARVDDKCWSTRTSVPAHELTHTLGGVLSTAPHATENGHCYDDSDLMCYDDGSGVTMQNVCASAQEQLLDCNHDDYFSTRPAAGSFLARNWNTASSSFLDTVVTDVPPPTVTVTSSTSAAETGDRVTFTASSPQTVSWAWSTSGNGASCALTPSAATAVLVCPATVVGDVVVTATATQTGASGRGSGAATVALAKADAPTATLSVPGTADAGDPVPVSVTPVGKAPFGYAWSAPPCTVAAPAAASTSLACAVGTVAQDVPVAVVVTQADGQTVRVSETLHLDAGASAPAVGTVWGSPTVRSGVMGAVLRTVSGTPLARRAVTLQAQWFGTSTWVDVRQLTTDANGLATAATAYDRAGSFRFASAADSGHRAAQSTPVFVKLGTRSSASKPSRWRVAGVLASTTGQRLAGQTVELQRRRAGTASWVTSVRLTTSAQGTVSRGVRPRHRTYYRWVFRGTGERVAATSGSVRVR